MNSTVTKILVLGCFAILLAACGPTAPQGETTPGDADDHGEVEGEVSDFTLKDVDGKDVSLSDYLGEKVIVMSFWATWCEPCKREMVQLDKLYHELKDDGLIFLSINMDEPESVGEVRPYVKQRGYTFPVLMDTESEVTNVFNPRRAAPFVLIISREQKIIWTHDSYVPGDEIIVENEVRKSLGLEPAAE